MSKCANLLILTTLLVAVAGCSSDSNDTVFNPPNTIDGSGNLVSHSFQVGAFTELTLVGDDQ